MDTVGKISFDDGLGYIDVAAGYDGQYWNVELWVPVGLVAGVYLTSTCC